MPEEAENLSDFSYISRRKRLMEKWVDQTDLPEEFNLETMYITYQTGDGSDHLVPVIFTRETVKDM